MILRTMDEEERVGIRIKGRLESGVEGGVGSGSECRANIHLGACNSTSKEDLAQGFHVGDLIISNSAGNAVIRTKVSALASGGGRAAAGEGRRKGLACKNASKRLNGVNYQP